MTGRHVSGRRAADPDPAVGTSGPYSSAVHLRRRTLALLTIGQILGGLGAGAAVSVGALAANNLAGEAWSGLASTVTTLGAAAVAVPLARLADRHGRRISLTGAALIAAVGAMVCIFGLSAGSLVVLLVGLGLLGAATAAGLQSRFAATDLASRTSRGRDLSLVVWSTTVGAVTGPNLAEPGNVLGAALGLAPLAGVFLFPVAAQLLAAAAYFVWLRPDPLLESRRLATVAVSEEGPSLPTDGGQGSPALVRVAIATVSLSHATMIALMSMTPVHLVHAGATLSIVGFTISLHIAGMFGLSPLFGILADRFGRFPIIVVGQAMLLAAAVITALGAHEPSVVMVGLIMLGLGWSASTVAGSALLSDAAPTAQRVRLQGRSDLVMNLAGAIGGALAGPLLALLGYPGLAWTLLLPVALVLAAGWLGLRRIRRMQVPA
jgi:MFS family permease